MRANSKRFLSSLLPPLAITLVWGIGTGIYGAKTHHFMGGGFAVMLLAVLSGIPTMRKLVMGEGKEMLKWWAAYAIADIATVVIGIVVVAVVMVPWTGE